MYFRIMAAVCAVSSSITAIFCIWIAINMFACDHQMEKMMRGRVPQSTGKPSTEAEMDAEREEIQRQLNSRTRK